MKWYRELLSVKGRRESGYFLIEGKRAVEQILRTAPESVEELLCSDENELHPSFSGIPFRSVAPGRLSSISASVHPQGILALVRIPEGSNDGTLPEQPGERIVLLDEVQDPGNIGTIIRSAAAFNFSGLLLTSGCADPFGPKAVQASAGAIFGPWIRRSADCMAMVAELQRGGYQLWGADVNGTAQVDFTGGNPMILALGNEGAGLSAAVRKMADALFAIPMNDNAVESLNVAVSGAIAFFTAFRGLRWE
ncbi:MAG: RNA methyltransferase [Chitinispirillaceae bacterium]|nr:RNA methyltransferase [Chitinispirillaceae bacterium]